jgi:hypothetical protein
MQLSSPHHTMEYLLERDGQESSMSAQEVKCSNAVTLTKGRCICSVDL